MTFRIESERPSQELTYRCELGNAQVGIVTSDFLQYLSQARALFRVRRVQSEFFGA